MIQCKKKTHIRQLKQYKKIKRNIVFGAFLIVSCISLMIMFYNNFIASPPTSNIQYNNRRKLLGDGYKIPGADYPQDALTEDQLKSGGVILHIIGLFYMFLAIAIVCDEFFVPAIEQIVEKLNLSPDVAGATFMAAGGSAPELFTAFIGTFISKSDVGFGTIVGSAVFNVLFVIGCCAIFSSGDLVLTWYPFARDSLYYCISLCTLAGFFYDTYIWIYEALILFAMYFGYVLIMINNARIYSWIDRKFIKTPERKRASTAAEQLRPPQAIQTFSVSLFKMMTADAKISEIAGIHMVARIKGDVKATFHQVDTDKSGYIDKDELRAVLQKLGGDVDEKEVQDCYEELDENDDGKIDYDEFSKWYLKSENRIETDIKQIFERFDHDGNGFIEVAELEQLVRACQTDTADEISPTDIENARKILDANNDGKISKEEFMNWYKSSIFFKHKQERQDELIKEEEEEDEGISLAFPTTMKGRIMYIISAPIVYTLYFTVPDVRKKHLTKWYGVSFIMSIVWLAVYSYLMVWWATVFGKIAGIPDGVMGLTLLAAGTSVPDLLTSVIVARQGHADMAVSSSIGSNIFDVLVGLPLPWIFACLSQFTNDGYRIKVFADSLFISILILFAMLGCVLAIIYFSKWRMTRPLGYSMFVLYFLFVIQDILRNCDFAILVDKCAEDPE